MGDLMLGNNGKVIFAITEESGTKTGTKAKLEHKRTFARTNTPLSYETLRMALHEAPYI